MNRPITEFIRNPIARLPDMHGTRIPLDEQQPAILPWSIHEVPAGHESIREFRELLGAEIREVSPEQAASGLTDRNRPATFENVYQVNNAALSRVDATDSTLPAIDATVIELPLDPSRATRIACVAQRSSNRDEFDQRKYSRNRAPVGTRQPAARAASNEREA